MSYVVSNVTVMAKEIAKGVASESKVGKFVKGIKEKKSIRKSIAQLRDSSDCSLKDGLSKVNAMKNIIKDMFKPLLDLASKSTKR